MLLIAVLLPWLNVMFLGASLTFMMVSVSVCLVGYMISWTVSRSGTAELQCSAVRRRTARGKSFTAQNTTAPDAMVPAPHTPLGPTLSV